MDNLMQFQCLVYALRYSIMKTRQHNKSANISTSGECFVVVVVSLLLLLTPTPFIRLSVLWRVQLILVFVSD